MSAADVVVIGGGLSGLSAAVRLAQRGAHVVLLEQSQKLGGRCYSYRDEKTGDVIDNGQHLLVGAYHHTLRYLELNGTRHFLKELPKLSLPFHHPEKGFATFEVASLPKPFHLTAGMLKFKLLSFSERQKMLKVGLELNRWNAALERKLSRLTIEQWLTELEQSNEAKRSFWCPIAISIMNELPECASALLFARSLKHAFLGKSSPRLFEKSDAAMLIPTVGQTELYVNGAVEFIKNHKGKIYTQSEVEAIEVDRSKVIGVRLKNGKHITAKSVISAVPHYALKRILPMKFKKKPPFDCLDKLDSSPIVSINLWFADTSAHRIMDMDYVGLIGKRLQWVFNRRSILQEQNKKTSYISAVISAAYDSVDLTKEELVKIAVRDLQSVFPNSKSAKLIHSVVIKEKRATFSATPESNNVRPATETQIKNFYVAGDWTQTGLPATIEGAVLSGVVAAQRIH